MSQSQASFYPESLIDPDLQSDDTPDLPSSQPTVTSIPGSDFTLPRRYPRAPDSLERVGPTLRKFWILYNSDPKMEHSRNQFVEWWLKTEFGSNPGIQDTIHWDGKKKSDLWESFEQVAHDKTGEPKVMCKRCHAILVHPHYRRAGSSPMKAHLKSGACLSKPKRRGIDQLIRDSVSLKLHLPIINRLLILNATKPRVPTSKDKVFSQDIFEEKLLNYITTARLPFRTVEQQEFKDLLSFVQLAQSKIDFPSARNIRRRLDIIVQEQQQSVLAKLPEGSRISIALDCWTSPFRQVFMAITGYFIDQEWEYREVLLGFEPLHGSHTGANLSETVFRILQEHSIVDRVLSITTDNATNNNTMMASVQETLQSLGLTETSTFRIPCIAHVIQLSLNELLGKMKAKPVNSKAESEWPDERTQSLQSRRPTRLIVDTLRKVYYLLIS